MSFNGNLIHNYDLETSYSQSTRSPKNVFVCHTKPGVLIRIDCLAAFKSLLTNQKNKVCCFGAVQTGKGCAVKIKK